MVYIAGIMYAPTHAKNMESQKKPPSILTERGLSMFVDAIKLRELPLPVIEVNIADLIWHFEMPVWEKDGTDDWNLTPWQVINKDNGTKGHQKRIKEADSSHPILLTKYNNRIAILDGMHRLAKAYMNNEKTIRAKLIPPEYLSLKEFQSPDIIPPEF